ncbi:hypothetical protein ACOTWZ_29390 [Burkholderia glumae]
MEWVTVFRVKGYEGRISTGRRYANCAGDGQRPVHYGHPHGLLSLAAGSAPLMVIVLNRIFSTHRADPRTSVGGQRVVHFPSMANYEDEICHGESMNQPPLQCLLFFPAYVAKADVVASLRRIKR